MSQDRPTAAELIDAVREFIEKDAVPELTGQKAFHARVAANALALAARELRDGPAADAAARDRLRRLLDEDGDLETLNRRLAERIRTGAMDGREGATLTHLLETARDKLRIAYPRHLPNEG